MNNSIRALRKLYFDSFEENPDKIYKVNINIKKPFIEVGEMTAIEYFSKLKGIDVPDSDLNLFRHNFDRKVKIYSNGSDLIIKGAKFTKRGFV